MIKLYLGDCIEVMRTLPDNSVDCCVTDPPYGIRFMGASWDGADIEKRTALRRANASHAPGAGPNGGHKSAAAEAGKYDLSPSGMLAFQMFSEDWAREVFRILKPGGHLLSFSSARTYHRMVCGIEAAGFEIRDQIMWIYGSGFPKSLDVSKAIDKAAGAELGRFPANVIHDGSDEVLAGFPNTKSNSGNLTQKAGVQGVAFGKYGSCATSGITDNGSAARFFYCAKASKSDRGVGNNHPTVKPTELMRYLHRLVCPLGGTSLDPFEGSGSSAKACALEGFNHIGIDRETPHLIIQHSRITEITPCILMADGAEIDINTLKMFY